MTSDADVGMAVGALDWITATGAAVGIAVVGSGAVGSDEGVDVGMTVVGLEDVGGDEPGFGVVGFDVSFV